MSTGKYIRLVVITLLGLGCIIIAARSRYHDGLLEAFGLLFIGVPAAILLLVSLVLDAKAYNRVKTKESWYPTLVGCVIIVLVIVVSVFAQWERNKPTLLRVYYDGDYNGIGIDFKTDGTFVYDDWAIGISDYHYGTYTIKGNKIEIDKIISPGLTGVHFEIRDMEVGPSDSTYIDKYLFQVDEAGKVINNIDFRVVEDNR